MGGRAGSKGLGTTPGEDPARDRLGARMRGPQPLHTPFTYFGKTRAIKGNGRRVRSPWGPDLLGMPICSASPTSLSQRGSRGNQGHSNFPARPAAFLPVLVSKETDADYRAPRGTNIAREKK